MKKILFIIFSFLSVWGFSQTDPNYKPPRNVGDKLGIGTITPSEKLHIVGKLKLGRAVIDSALGTSVQVLGSDGSGNWAMVTKYSTYVNAALSSDHTTSGELITLTATSNSAIGDIVYIASTGKASLCDASVIATCPYAFAICADASISADAAGNWLTRGVVRDDTWNWTPGGIIYATITGTTGNTLSQTAPTATNEVVLVVGIALTADIMYFFGGFLPIELN